MIPLVHMMNDAHSYLLTSENHPGNSLPPISRECSTLGTKQENRRVASKLSEETISPFDMSKSQSQNIYLDTTYMHI